MLHRIILVLLLILSFCRDVRGQDWLWARGVEGGGPSRIQEGVALNTDKDGNILLGGTSNADSTVFGNVTLYTSFPGTSYMYIAKYDPNGNIIWARKADTPAAATCFSAGADSSGNVYAAGLFLGSYLVAGGDTVFNNSTAGNADNFVIKYDAAGNFMWIRSFGGTGYELLKDIAVTQDGKCVIAGQFNSPAISFGSSTLYSNGGYDIYLAELDANGSVNWAQSFGTQNGDGVGGVDVDYSDNVYLSGTFVGDSIQIGSYVLADPNNFSYSNFFVAKIDSSGSTNWARTGDGTAGTGSYWLSYDKLGSVYVCGIFENELQLGNYTFYSVFPNTSMFLARYDTSGNVIWLRAGICMSNGGCFPKTVSADAFGNIFISGVYSSDPPGISCGNYLLPPVNPGPDPFFTMEYDSSGSVRCIHLLPSGGDDENAIVADGTGNAITGGDFWGMNPYYIIGNDSLAQTCVENAFFAKFHCSCKSTLAIVGDDSICAGDAAILTGYNAETFEWLPNTFSQTITVAPSATSTYSLVGTSYQGCSDTITATVTVTPIPDVSLDLSYCDTLCSQINTVLLTGGSPPGGTYSGTSVITSLFHPAMAGTGTWPITYVYTDAAGCSSSAIDSIHVVDCTGINVKSLQDAVLIFPNPSSGNFTLTGNFPLNAQLHIYNMLGQEVAEAQQIPPGNNAVPVNVNLAGGVYVCRILVGKDVVHTQKLIITK